MAHPLSIWAGTKFGQGNPGHRDPRVLRRDRVDDATFGGLACGRARCVGAFRCDRRFLDDGVYINERQRTRSGGARRSISGFDRFDVAAAWLLVKPELNKVTALRTVVLVSGVFIARWWSVSPIEILAGAAIIGALWSCEKDP